LPTACSRMGKVWVFKRSRVVGVALGEMRWGKERGRLLKQVDPVATDTSVGLAALQAGRPVHPERRWFRR
jgi:hypothetical protein